MIEEIIKIAKEAGKITLEERDKGLEISTKHDDFDFVTSADDKSEKYIIKSLNRISGYPVLAEETQNMTSVNEERIWIVDPLDGTKDFKNGGEGFSVMIGLCDKGEPSLGVVYAPAKDLIYYAEKGKGAYLQRGEGKPEKIIVSNVENLEKSAMVTRIKHGELRPEDDFIDSIEVLEKIPESSIGIKLGLISEGKAEVSINTNFRANKWDTCAPQIILEEAGGKITDFNGKRLDYLKESNKWEDSFFATNGNRDLHKEVLKKITENYKE